MSDGPSGLPDPTLPLLPGPACCVHAAFLECARARPDAVALVSQASEYSYGELSALSAALAHTLRARGIGPAATVAVYAERSPALVACLLGVLRSGAAFQILDAAYPVPRLLACVRAAKPSLLLIAGDKELPGELAQALSSDHQPTLRVPSDLTRAAQVLDRAADTPLAEVDPEGLAYVSFTSGSTGVPKGILTSHAPLPHFVAWHIEHGNFAPEDRFSMLSGLGHDPLLRDIFTPLSLGASLHIPPQATIFDADALWAFFASSRISVAHLTPALGEILLTGAPEGGSLPALRRIYWGGDVLRPKLARQIAELAPNLRQVNFYGATETPQAMAYFELSQLSELEQVPLGRGIEGAQLLVMHESDRLCSVGELGEVWIRSPYLSRGYLDPAQSRERFVPNPFGSSERDLCYRTGDQARYLASGEVVFAGRADHQIKVRGFRVEPAEVVSALERARGVQRAIVLAPELHGEKQLVAYVVGERGIELTPSELRSAVQRELPAYMVPRAVFVLPAFPLLPNGKVDLQALPRPSEDLKAVRQEGAQRLPRNEAERKLAALWSEILGIEEIGIDESFLDLGGDSLSAIRALSRMRRLGIPEDVARGIFQGRTIAELCDVDASDPNKAVPLRGAAKVTLLVNVLRGVLVLTLVFDHWREGLFKRLPMIPAALLSFIEPLFHLPTPGFAFVFGIGLGHSHYETFLKSPEASRRLLRGGALLLGAGTLLMGLSRNLGVIARGLPLDSHLFFVNFFLPTLYYWLALATAPLWFALIARREKRWGGAILGALLLAAAARGGYELCRFVLLEREQQGFLQLTRLMLVARFSYFNLSTGALLGIAFGMYLRGQRTREHLLAPLTAVGGGLLTLGLLAYWTRRDAYPEHLLSADIWLPEWLVYCGASLLIGALLELLLIAPRTGFLRPALQWVGVVGQCAMPIFILQGMALDISAFGRALGLPDKLAVMVSLGSFVLVVGWMMRRIHALYYGHVPSRLRETAVAPAPL